MGDAGGIDGDGIRLAAEKVEELFALHLAQGVLVFAPIGFLAGFIGAADRGEDGLRARYLPPPRRRRSR